MFKALVYLGSKEGDLFVVFGFGSQGKKGPEKSATTGIA